MLWSHGKEKSLRATMTRNDLIHKVEFDPSIHRLVKLRGRTDVREAQTSKRKQCQKAVIKLECGNLYSQNKLSVKKLNLLSCK